MLLNRRVLGLAVTERSMIAVEVGSANGRLKAFRAGIFVCPQDPGLQDPAELGKALRQFLRKEGFSARRCVIGMEAKWLTAREKALPPGSADSLGGILSIMAEREFASERENLLFDYIGPTGGDQGEHVLLVAASRRHVAHLQAMAEAAGLSVTAITSTAIALTCSSDRRDVPERIVLHLVEGGAELVVQSKGSLRLVRRFSLLGPQGGGADAASGWLDDLLGQLGRVMSLLPGEQTAAQERELHVWNGADLDSSSLAVLAERISPQAKLCRPSLSFDMASLPRELQRDDIAAATCLGAAALQGRLPGVDFLHSRLSPPRKPALSRRAVWIAGAAGAIVLASAVLLLDWRSRQQQVNVLQSKFKAMEASVAEARDVIDKEALARSWYDRRPRYLECMREVTLAFPAEGRIWATSL
ncbi:MAG: hypothetical protein AMJ81_05665, partial [Phycisphaerae bacterium SM23_33]